MTRAFILLALGLALPSGAALAASPPQNSILGKHDSNAPINITADKVLADLNRKSITYTGNVIVIQGDVRMRANMMKVNTADGKADTIEAHGGVIVDSPRSGTATGDAGLYDVKPRTVTLTGRVVLTRAKDVLRGTKLTVNLNTGQAVLGAQGAAPAAAGQRGGRVQGVFTPNQTDGN